MRKQQRLFLVAALAATSASAQWINFPMPGIPRTPDGKAILTAPAPRVPGGKPDLSGVWHVQPTPFAEMQRLMGDRAGVENVPGMEIDTISKYAVNVLMDFQPAESPLRKETIEKLKRRTSDSRVGECLPVGIPLAGLLSEPIKIIQSPNLMVILYESDGSHRQIYTDGRALPAEIAQPAWLGYSAGHWDGDTLVVESGGFNDKTNLDLIGHPRSEAFRLTERYHRRDFGHMDVEMTFDDPENYTRPFTVKVTNELQPNSDIFEFFCNENEKDLAHAKHK